MKRSNFCLLGAACLLACASGAWAQHAGDIWVGRSAAGQLKIDTVCAPGCGFDPSQTIVILQPDDLGGYSLSSPGFDRIVSAQPEGEDVLPLQSGAQIRLQVASNTQPVTLGGLTITPPLLIYDPVTFTFFPYEMSGTIYREVFLGNYQLHKHVAWFVDATDPVFDPTQCVWEVTARLIDTGTTGYAPSEPFTLRFALHPLVPGDFDCDEDVDEDDLAFFVSCASGPSVALADDCRKADLTGDGDADSADFAILQRSLTGAGVRGKAEVRGEM